MLTAHHLPLSLPVWRILYDTIPVPATRQILVVELRNKHQLKWCAIDCDTTSILWENTFAETDRWTAAIGLYAGTLLLHTYAGNEQPAPKRLSAVNALTGKMMWVLEECKFEQTDGVYLQTSKNLPESAPVFENRLLTTGNPVEVALIFHQTGTADWQFSTVYTPSNPYYSVIARFIEKITRHIPEKAINYSEISGHILIFYYFYPANASTLSRSILVINSTKTVLLHETIHSQVEGAAFDEYLYDNQHIVFLRKIDEITVLKLPRP